MLRRRACLPVASGRRLCTARICFERGCSLLDCFGDYEASCPWTGGLRRRGAAVERAYRPLWAEAPVHAREHPLVNELVRSVPAHDLRQSDGYIRGLSLGRGLPVVGDMSMISKE